MLRPGIFETFDRSFLSSFVCSLDIIISFLSLLSMGSIPYLAALVYHYLRSAVCACGPRCRARALKNRRPASRAFLLEMSCSTTGWAVVFDMLYPSLVDLDPVGHASTITFNADAFLPGPSMGIPTGLNLVE